MGLQHVMVSVSVARVRGASAGASRFAEGLHGKGLHSPISLMVYEGLLQGTSSESCG